MFKPNTLLIVGAGASAEVGLPVGVDLVDQIAGILNFPRDEVTGRIPSNDFTRELMNRAGPEKVREYERAAVKMIRGMRSAESVDRFIDRFSDDEYIRTLGKAAIVKAISFKERKSDLASDKGETISGRSKIDDTWYWTLARMLFEGVGISQLENVFDGLSIVCFNYDRCIEHFLTHELMRSFNLQLRDAAALVNRLTIWHPYGTIAPLKTQDGNGIGFGESESVSGRCFELSSRIRTFTEKHEDRAMIDAIRARIRAAETVVFLGFGFYEQNLQLIEPDGPTQIRWILGTGHKLSESAKFVVQERLGQWDKGEPPKIEVITQMKCAELLDHYRMQLSR